MVACMYFQCVALKSDFYPSIASLPLSAAGFFKYLQGRDYRLLVCGHVFFNHRRSAFFLPELAPAELQKLLSRCLREVLKISGADIFLAKEPSPDLKGFLANHPGRFLSVGPDYLMNLHLKPEWNSSADYAKDLKKKYLQRLKKITENAAVFSWADATLADFDNHQQDIMSAYQNVLDEAEFKLGKLNYNFFRQLIESKSQKTVFRLWFLENKFIGFSILLLQSQAVELYYIGLAKEEEIKRNLYPAMMLNALDFGIENKLKMVRFGRTALEAKAMMGAEPEELTHYIAFQNRWLRYPALAILRYAGKVMGTAWKTRKPFRLQPEEQSIQQN